MDMWAPYISAAKQCLPEAAIVHDKFHIAKYLGEAVNQVRKGGAPKSIHILGRNRKIYKIDRKSYITYKGEKILLSVAKKIKLKSKTKN